MYLDLTGDLTSYMVNNSLGRNGGGETSVYFFYYIIPIEYQLGNIISYTVELRSYFLFLRTLEKVLS